MNSPQVVTVALIASAFGTDASPRLTISDKPHVPQFTVRVRRSEEATEVATGTMAMQMVKAPARLTVASPAFARDQRIPETFSDLGQKISPSIKWAGAPEGTESFVLIMEDADSSEPKPFVHWLIYDLPATIAGLRMAVPGKLELTNLDKARQGRNSRGSIGYFGPHPAAGEPPHHYHFQVFALDSKLNLLPGRSKAEVVHAMQGRVLAAGEIVGTYRTEKKVFH